MLLILIAHLIIELKKRMYGQIEYIANYHDKKSDNSLTITATPGSEESLAKLKVTLDGEVRAMLQKK